ncbi:MAG: hypothetical protein O7D86_02870 [Proteobacteria bacterium]|nr:hypothetical protein [Pseudomonadota bacterium]
MNNKHETPKKIIAWLLIYSHFLAGCVTTGSQDGVIKAGPELSSSYEEKAVEAISMGAKLDVIIPVFDPGLSETAENYEEDGIWPELRRAEANRFAYKLKQALDDGNAFAAVRVTPDKTASGDLYVLGKIEESNGQDVKFVLNVIDISGKEWLNKTFKHEVKESFYKNYRSSGTDPYAPVFKQAADKIIEALKKRSFSELDDLKYIADLRFGASFNDAVFLEYMNTGGKYIKLVSKPSDNDPMLQRVTAIRVREQLFVDSLQQNYASFSQSMDDSYLRWQEASFTETQLRKEAKTKSVMNAIGGVLLIGLAIAAAVSSSNNSSFGTPDPGLATAAIVGGVAGAWMLSSSFKSKEEAEFHKGAIDELGESINIEMAPRVVSFEDETVELTGNIQEQFTQWREFLKRIYEQEATPDTTF